MGRKGCGGHDMRANVFKIDDLIAQNQPLVNQQSPYRIPGRAHIEALVVLPCASHIVQTLPFPVAQAAPDHLAFINNGRHRQ